MGKTQNKRKTSRSESQKRFKPNGEKRYPVKRTNVLPDKGQSLWAISVTIISFVLSISILFISTGLFETISPFFSFLVVLVIVMLGVVFDLVGVAVTAADEKPFHSMASKKYSGAKHAIKLIRNADKVSSICNDVVGDICGVVSGTAGAAIVYRLFSGTANSVLIEAVVGGLIAAVTVGGKAFAKRFGLNNSNYIIYKIGSLFALFKK
ncbi:MAG: Mg2+ and Co2+ transporter CorB [Clostridiaceae bacterium]|jgi:magnesium-transporting ATPase (P-type)|nr:Mg2+ and Co2+ transporter CorB [Clostridiaceae bacterium]